MYASILISTTENTHNKKNKKTALKIQSIRSDLKISSSEHGLYIQPSYKFGGIFLLMIFSFMQYFFVMGFIAHIR